MVEEVELESDWWFFKRALIFVTILGVVIFIIGLYSISPQAIKTENEHSIQLQNMSCTELFTQLMDNVPHGYTVGGAGAIMDDYGKALITKGCIKK